MYPVSLTADLSVFFSYKIKNESTADLEMNGLIQWGKKGSGASVDNSRILISPQVLKKTFFDTFFSK